MKLRCPECVKMVEATLDDLHGEYSCDDCGLILLDQILDDKPKEMVEQTSYKYASKGIGTDTSIHRMTSSERKIQVGIDYCTMICAEVDFSRSLREQVYYYYRHLKVIRQVGRKWTYEERACALAFYVMRENNLPCSVAQISQHLEAQPKRVSQCARVIATSLGKPHILSQTNYGGLAQRYGQELGIEKSFEIPTVFNYLSKISESSGFPVNPTLVAVSITIYVKLVDLPITQSDIANVCNISNNSIGKARKRLFGAMGTEMKAMKFITLEQFINGVYE